MEYHWIALFYATVLTLANHKINKNEAYILCSSSVNMQINPL